MVLKVPMTSIVPKVPNVAMVSMVLKVIVVPKPLVVPKVLLRLRCYAACGAYMVLSVVPFHILFYYVLIPTMRVDMHKRMYMHVCLHRHILLCWDLPTEIFVLSPATYMFCA